MEKIQNTKVPQVLQPSQSDEFGKACGPSLDRNSPDYSAEPYDHIFHYLHSERPQWSGWRELSRRLAGTIAPLAPECRLSVAIPVAAHEEQAHIGRALKSFLQQTADFKTFELVLFANHPAAFKNGTKILPDGTLDVIRRFSYVHPELALRTIYQPLPEHGCRIGNIRKLLNDAILFRYIERGPGYPDHILMRADADTLALHPQLVENYIKRFERNPQVDSFFGQMDFDPASYIKYPLLHLICRIEDKVFNWLMRCSDVRPGGTPNFAIKASTYAWVGGEDRRATTGEDTLLTRALFEARKGARFHQPAEFAGSASRLYTSSRRLVAAFECGAAPSEQWDGSVQPFSHQNGDIRAAKQDSALIPYGEWIREDIGVTSLRFFGNLARFARTLFSSNRGSSGTVASPQPGQAEFRRLLESYVNRSVHATMNAFRFSNGGPVPKELVIEGYRRALQSFAMKYEFTDGSFRILDCSKAAKSLELYQNEGEARVARKLGTPIDL